MPLEPTSALCPGQFREHIFGLHGRRIGAFKRAAVFAGMTLDEYVDRLDSGEKRCTRCRQWRPRDKFGSEATRWDGLDAKCLACHRQMGRDRYEPIPIEEWKPMGPPRNDPRDDDKIQARQLVNRDVQTGLRPHPNDLHCSYCGHKGPDRRHEYHHHLGYSAIRHYDVIALCTTCHHEEH